MDIPALCPAELFKSLAERRQPALNLRVGLILRHQKCDVPQSGRLLRARCKRPCGCRAAKKCDELAPLHSMTSSASDRNDSGIVRPSTLAVVILITSSNLVG